MNQELAQLEAELAEVMACELEYLPKYGYAHREGIIEEIKLDIEDVKAEMSANELDWKTHSILPPFFQSKLVPLFQFKLTPFCQFKLTL